MSNTSLKFLVEDLQEVGLPSLWPLNNLFMLHKKIAMLSLSQWDPTKASNTIIRMMKPPTKWLWASMLED
jgi:hypothetical protein